MSCLYRKWFNGSLLLLGCRPTVWPAGKAFHGLIIPISPPRHPSPRASYLSPMVLAHLQAFNVLLWRNNLSLQPGLQDSTWASSWDTLRKIPSTPVWIWFRPSEFPQPLNTVVFSTHHKETQYSFTCLSSPFHQMAKSWKARMVFCVWILTNYQPCLSIAGALLFLLSKIYL